MANENKKENFSAVVIANALQTSQNGTDSVAIQVNTIANLVTGEEIEKTIVGNLWITPGAIDRTIKTLREAFDYKENSFVPLNDPNCLLGKQCEITVEYEEYNGEMRPKIQWFNAAGSFAARRIKPLAPQLATSIGARFDAYFTTPAQPAQNNANAYGRASTGYGARPAQAQAQPQQGNVPEYNADDDLPF